MTTTQSQYDEENTLSPSDYARLAPFAEELRRLARDIDKVIRKRAPLPRCLSGLTAMRPLINLIEESTIKLLACTAEDDEPESTPSLEIDGKQNRDSTPGYL
jgi:hypothetical protein